MRIKRGVNRHRKHAKLLNLTKGYRLSNGTLIKRSKEALVHAGQYNLAHRRHRRAQMKTDWISAVNAALSQHDMSYSKFHSELRVAGIKLNSKMLAHLAVDYPQDFNKLVERFK
jgi:large subunit ribosomal protein L20